MPDLVRLRNHSGTDLHVAFLQGRLVPAGDSVEVAGRLLEQTSDAVLIAHPTAGEDQVLAWPTVTWELVTDKPAKAGKE